MGLALSSTQFLALGGLFLTLSAYVCNFLGQYSLNNRLNPEQLALWKKGVLYQFCAALGVLGIAFLSIYVSKSDLFFGGWTLFIGGIIFSASYCLYALTNNAIWLFLTPIGRSLIILSWIILVIGLIK